MTRLLGLTLASSLALPSIAAAAEPVPGPAEAQPVAAAPAEAVTDTPAAAETVPTASAEATATPGTDAVDAAEGSEPTSAEEPPAPVLTEPADPEAPPPVAKPIPQLPPSGEALMITGASMFGTMYLATSFAGAVAIDNARYDVEHGYAEPTEDNYKDDLNRGRALTIPLVGPFIAMRFTDSAKRRYGLAVNGSLQVAGLALAVVGAMRHKRYRAARRRWQMSASADTTGAQVGMQLRF